MGRSSPQCRSSSRCSEAVQPTSLRRPKLVVPKDWLLQRDSAEGRARLDRQTKLLEIFNAKITSPNVRDQKMAILLLRIVDPDVAIQLANAVTSDENSAPEVKQAAHAVVTEANRGNAFAVIASPKELNVAVDFSRKVGAESTQYPVEIYLTGDHGFYAVTLGGYLPLETL